MLHFSPNRIPCFLCTYGSSRKRFHLPGPEDVVFPEFPTGPLEEIHQDNGFQGEAGVEAGGPGIAHDVAFGLGCGSGDGAEAG